MSARRKDSTEISETAAAQQKPEPELVDKPVEDDDFVEEEFKPSEADGDMFGGMPAKKAQHFWPSAKRLMGLLKPEALGI